MDELDRKLAAVRTVLDQEGASAVRLRGVDWFAWATCGGSNVVLLTTDVGVAEVLITRTGAWVLTDEIEAARLVQEELPKGFEVFACPWTERATALDRAVRERAGGGAVLSDRPAAGEKPLPSGLVRRRWSLEPEELERYRNLGRDAAQAMTEVLQSAGPEWTGYELAGAGAEALWARGIEPALTLVGDEARLPVHRHATASAHRLHGRAMLVFCGRRHGLFANLTRFVYFRAPTDEERALDEAVALVEADAWDASKPGTSLGALYDALVAAYARHGQEGGERKHHQGGPCGYLSRDAVAVPGMQLQLVEHCGLALNPSLPGAKIEDTVVVSSSGLEILTADPRWPTRMVAGRPRPAILER